MARVQDPDGHWIDLRATQRDEHGRGDKDRGARRPASRWARHSEDESDRDPIAQEPARSEGEPE